MLHAGLNIALDTRLWTVIGAIAMSRGIYVWVSPLDRPIRRSSSRVARLVPGRPCHCPNLITVLMVFGPRVPWLVIASIQQA